MLVSIKSQEHLSPRDLAEALARSKPSEFAEFWFEFNLCVEAKKIEKFAEAMAPEFGGKRKEPFKKLYTMMEYYEIKEGMK